MKTINSVILIILLAALVGCGSDDSTTPPPPTDAEVLRSAWNALHLGDTATAESGFRTLIARGVLLPEAYDGLGWTFTVAADAQAALDNFRTAVELGVDDTGANDQARAGQCFAANATGNHAEAIDAGNRVAENWTFIHTSELTFADVALTMASSHYRLGEFTESLAALQMADPSFNADVGTVDGRALLAARIEELLNA